jgi:hypothetical protein
VRFVVIGTAVAVLLSSAAGRAEGPEINPCFGEANGVACTGLCISVGTCVDGVCVPVQLVPDGTRCATTAFCAGVQECRAGACTTISPRVCPSVDACHVGRCDPDRGCVVDDICPPDLATAADLTPSAVDLAPAATPDLAQPVDLPPAATPDLAQPVDLPPAATPDLGVDGAASDGAAPPSASDDLSDAPPGDLGFVPHVRGSNVALFCAVSSYAAPFGAQAAGLLLLFLLAALFVARLRKR